LGSPLIGMSVNVGGRSAALIARHCRCRRITVTAELINTNQVGASSAHSATPSMVANLPAARR
jgi:hypothetical protein